MKTIHFTLQCLFTKTGSCFPTSAVPLSHELVSAPSCTHVFVNEAPNARHTGLPSGPRAASATKKGNDGKAAKVTILISGQPEGPSGRVLEGDGGTEAQSPKTDADCVSEVVQLDLNL